MNTVREFALANPVKFVVVVPPLLRLTPLWYFSQHALILDVWNSLFKQSQCSNLYSFKLPEQKNLKFNSDNVHLSPQSGFSYARSLVDQCVDLVSHLSSEGQISDSDLTDDADVTVLHSSPKTPQQPSANAPVTLDLLYAEIRKNNEIAGLVKENEKKITETQDQLISGFKSTDLAIARLSEDQDFSSNVLKENRVTIGSLVISERELPSDRAGWTIFIIQKVKSIISDLFKKDSQLIPNLLGVSVRSTRLNVKKEFPNFDAIFENTAHALSFRRTVGSASRQPNSPIKLFVSNCVSLSTRVRIDVLLALSRHLNSTGVTSHVQSFVSRPVIHIRNKNSAVSKVYTYTDCVKEFGATLCKLDLSSAYKRAGTYFAGTMSRFFVVLKDDAPGFKPRPQSRQKRPLDSSASAPLKRSR